MQDEHIERMTVKLPVLRVVVGLTQEQLAKKLGVSRQTIVAIENGKRPLSWSLYLAMVLIFMQNKDSNRLMESLELFDTNIINKIV